MPTADSVIKAVHAIIRPDPHTPGLLHGPFLLTDQGLAATLHFRAHDDTHGLGATGEFYIRQAGLTAGVSCGLSSQMLHSLPDLRKQCCSLVKM
jgi:hypothetical protein